MASIFVSYARQDRELVAPLARSLEEKGWSVWWDRAIPPGRRFDQVIEEELEAAGAIIAVWTSAGVTSDWVHNEAAEGAARNVLVPVLMEAAVRIPFAFRRIHAADLVGWIPDDHHDGYDQLIRSLKSLLDQTPTEIESQIAPHPPLGGAEQVSGVDDSSKVPDKEAASAGQTDVVEPPEPDSGPDQPSEPPIKSPNASLGAGTSGVANADPTNSVADDLAETGRDVEPDNPDSTGTYRGLATLIALALIVAVIVAVVIVQMSAPNDDAALGHEDGDADTDASPNDKFSQATAISGTTGRETGSTRGASREPNEPSHLGQAEGASVWFEWQGGPGELTVDTQGSDFDTVLAVYTGAAIDQLAGVESDHDGGADGTSRVEVEIEDEQTYSLAVDGFSGESGDFVLNWSFVPVHVAPTGTEVRNETPRTVAPPDASDASEHEASDSDPPLDLEGRVEVAAGTVLDLDECPDEWSATQGVTDDEIRLGQSLPQTGDQASFAAIGDGMRYWFDHVNATDPVDGKAIVLVVEDDGYETGRAVANVEEMLSTGDVFSLMPMVGAAINLAVRPVTDEACVPQLFNYSGFPYWGDPARFPWTIGGTLGYVSEAEIWCRAIVEELGAGATVAALLMNSAFGETYQQALQGCSDAGQIELVAEQFYDPAAPDLTNEMAALASSGAEVLIAGATAEFCGQAVAALEDSAWRPRFYVSYSCDDLANSFGPVMTQVDDLAQSGSGVRMANPLKTCGDPQYADDPSVLLIEDVLATYGGVSCADGRYATGVILGQYVTDVLRSAADLPGGLNRVNLMAAIWNADMGNDNLLGGVVQVDGVHDPLWIESAQIQEVVVENDALGFVDIGSALDLEANGG